MFDVLLGLSAVVNAAVEVVAVKEANEIGTKQKPEHLKTDYEKSVEFYEKRSAEMAAKGEPLVPDMSKAKKHETVWDKKRKKFREQERQKRALERQNNENRQPENPLAMWVMNHDEMILEVLNSGVHVIPNKDLDGINPDTVAEFLFKTETVEKVEKVPEGLEVTVR